MNNNSILFIILINILINSFISSFFGGNNNHNSNHNYHYPVVVDGFSLPDSISNALNFGSGGKEENNNNNNNNFLNDHDVNNNNFIVNDDDDEFSHPSYYPNHQNSMMHEGGGNTNTISPVYLNDDMTKPSEFFGGVVSRPLLEILKPENGHVLDDNVVDILVKVSGYELPSKLHDSQVCLGLASQGERILEECFEQSESMEYKVNGLSPGTTYMLRVVLFERSAALAVSVRSFRVGAISINNNNNNNNNEQQRQPELKTHIPEEQKNNAQVTIQTALQLAVEQHHIGKHMAAEHIYRQIIDEFPEHPDALHLLGLVLYQKGDPFGAIGYIEKAIETNSSFEAFHNSLGECFRIVGRTRDAIDQFEAALDIRRNFLPARFNMGLAYQQLRDTDTAIKIYSEISNQMVNNRYRGDSVTDDQIEDTILLESHIRLCDLLQATNDITNAQDCWENGLRRWPGDPLMYNELGNLHVNLDNLQLAREYYEGALHYGMHLAELNIAIVLELEGNSQESVERYAAVLESQRLKGLQDRYIMIKMATVLPRVMPVATELERFRNRFNEKLDELLESPWDFTDNSEPTNNGFSLGFHLAFHGENNVALKSKLYRIYSTLCPALTTANFLTENNIIIQSHVALVQTEETYQQFSARASASEAGKGLPGPRGYSQHQRYLQLNNNNENSNPVNHMGHTNSRRIRIGFISRFFYNHPVGILSSGIIAKLPRSKYKVYVFMIDPPEMDDRVSSYIRNSADELLILPTELNICADIIRDQHLDVLIYPEIGSDPVSYFLSYARFAPVQAVWWGHPDTSGISTLDYFISSTIETPNADKYYSERLYRMNGLGAYFIRPEVHDMNPQAIKARIMKELNLPSKVHFYLCPQALFKFHPNFDDVLIEILKKDKLGYLLLLNGRDRAAWSKHLLSRMMLKMKEDQIHRVLFYSVTGDQEMLSLYLASDVVLDTFPAGGYINSLQAFGVGVPVVTLPSNVLSGRLTLGMYEKMGLDKDSGCVAKDEKDYVSIALKLAHNPAARAKVVSRILATNYKLFEDNQAIKEWDKFLTTILR